jgi:hypothetical protein
LATGAASFKRVLGSTRAGTGLAMRPSPLLALNGVGQLWVEIGIERLIRLEIIHDHFAAESAVMSFL